MRGNGYSSSECRIGSGGADVFVGTAWVERGIVGAAGRIWEGKAVLMEGCENTRGARRGGGGGC